MVLGGVLYDPYIAIWQYISGCVLILVAVSGLYALMKLQRNRLLFYAVLSIAWMTINTAANFTITLDRETQCRMSQVATPPSSAPSCC
jgi:hypothetical protein